MPMLFRRLIPLICLSMTGCAGWQTRRYCSTSTNICYFHADMDMIQKECGPKPFRIACCWKEIPREMWIGWGQEWCIIPHEMGHADGLGEEACVRASDAWWR